MLEQRRTSFLHSIHLYTQECETLVEQTQSTYFPLFHENGDSHEIIDNRTSNSMHRMNRATSTKYYD